MSYSRWSNSCWYTYWDCDSGETLETQVLTIQDIGSFDYQELTSNLPKVLEEVSVKRPKTTKEEMYELIGYIEQFVAEMSNSTWQDFLDYDDPSDY